MKSRPDIALTPEEQERFLDDVRTITLASIDKDGWPHLVAMWFCRIDGLVHMTTFRKSQKAVNLRRDPRVTLLAESGATYSELRGLMIRGEAEVVDDLDTALEVMGRVREKHFAGNSPEADDALRAQATKRVVIRVHPRHASSWDHTKLGGRY